MAQFIEPGASVTDDKRWFLPGASLSRNPATTFRHDARFQRMIERACDGDHAFDLIVVHSYSLFFRDAFGLEYAAMLV